MIFALLLTSMWLHQVGPRDAVLISGDLRGDVVLRLLPRNRLLIGINTSGDSHVEHAFLFKSRRQLRGLTSRWSNAHVRYTESWVLLAKGNRQLHLAVDREGQNTAHGVVTFNDGAESTTFNTLTALLHLKPETASRLTLEQIATGIVPEGLLQQQ